MVFKPQQNAYVLGVGLTEFLKPRRTRDYVELGFEAGVKAMKDAQINYDDVETGIACWCYGQTTQGQRIFYQFGMTSIPIYNTNNACSTGSAGLHMARTLVRSGAADCVLVVGFETMEPGAIQENLGGRPSPMRLSTDLMEKTRGKHEDSPRNAQYFGNAGLEYMEKYVIIASYSVHIRCTNGSGLLDTAPQQTTSQKLAAYPTSTRRRTLTPSSNNPTPFNKSKTPA